MKARLNKVLMDYRFLFVLYCIVAIIASITQVLKDTPIGSGEHINNYLIFKTSFTHLVSGGDLYTLWPKDHIDYYKYSPAFALLMAPFSLFNNLTGVILWNLLNSLVLFFAIRNLPLQNNKAPVYILWFVLLELITSMQNCQSNGLMAALMIAGFNNMEKGRTRYAAFFIALSVYIKLFSLLAFLVMMLYPRRRKSLATITLFMIVFAVLPVIVISFNQLLFLYKSWAHLLSEDHSASMGLSVLGWLQTWFRINPEKIWITVIGFILMIMPMLRLKLYGVFQFRLLLLASVLVWVIIFNHKAESPTFIVAVSGVALWYFSKPRGYLDKLLLVLVIIFTCLSPTDFFPIFFRTHLVVPYVLKAVPCILVWIRIIYELMTIKENPSPPLTAPALK